jgi:hypothetical protein
MMTMNNPFSVNASTGIHYDGKQCDTYVYYTIMSSKQPFDEFPTLLKSDEKLGALKEYLRQRVLLKMTYSESSTKVLKVVKEIYVDDISKDFVGSSEDVTSSGYPEILMNNLINLRNV